ncbi:acetyl esterase, partial [Paenibacillus riograndensis]
MNTIELRKQELENCRPEPTLEQGVVNEFWDGILAEYARKPLEIISVPEVTPYPGMRVDKVSFQSFDKTRVHAWHIQPAQAGNGGGPLPCIITFPGYTGDRGYPERYASWVLLGYSVLAVDVRGQLGETGNLLPMESGVAKGWITQGLLEKEHSYYMAVAMDTVSEVETAAQLPGVDLAVIGMTSGTQGGGMRVRGGALVGHG